MTFVATDEQVAEICALAVNSSIPAGWGLIHASAGNYKANEFIDMVKKGRVDMDYYGGRMVKLGMERLKATDGAWEVTRGERPNKEYQSWAHSFPTIEALVSRVIAAPSMSARR